MKGSVDRVKVEMRTDNQEEAQADKLLDEFLN